MPRPPRRPPDRWAEKRPFQPRALRAFLTPEELSTPRDGKRGVTTDEMHQAEEATFRIEPAKLIAGLAGTVLNIDLATELAQDALTN